MCRVEATCSSILYWSVLYGCCRSYVNLEAWFFIIMVLKIFLHSITVFFFLWLGIVVFGDPPGPSPSGWMDEPLTEQYCHKVIGTFTFSSWQLLAQYSFSCHLTLNNIICVLQFSRFTVYRLYFCPHLIYCIIQYKLFIFLNVFSSSDNHQLFALILVLTLSFWIK